MLTDKLYHQKYDTEIDLAYGYLDEHDMDLFLIEEMFVNQDFLDIFAKKSGIHRPYQISSIYHNWSDTNGETDITVILDTYDKKHALLIENKINAPAQPQQFNRYIIRGDSRKNLGYYQSYSIILVAPDRYTATNAEAKLYPIKVSYTELIDFLIAQNNDRARFRAGMILATITDKENSLYIVEKDENVTEFWRKLYSFSKQEYPDLEIKITKGDRGKYARWVEFYTSLKKVGITIKSNRGVVDMFFPGYGERIGTLKQIIGQYLTNEMELTATGKSASVRLQVSGFDFHGGFEYHIPQVREAYEAVRELKKLATCLDYVSLYPIRHIDLQNTQEADELI